MGAVVTAGAWSTLGSDAPPAPSLSAALGEAPAPRPVSLSPAVPPPAWADVPAQGVAPADLPGRYTAVAGPSFVGYRAREVLGGVGANTVVGRSRDLSASFEFDGARISQLEVTVDMRSLASDDERRDSQLRAQAIESDRFPSARFVVSEPFNLGAVPVEGEELHLVLVGDLTLHGVTRPVTAHVYSARKGEVAVVVGTVEVLFSDFGIRPPRSIVVVSVEDHATVEFQLVFRKS